LFEAYFAFTFLGAGTSIPTETGIVKVLRGDTCPLLGYNPPNERQHCFRPRFSSATPVDAIYLCQSATLPFFPVIIGRSAPLNHPASKTIGHDEDDVLGLMFAKGLSKIRRSKACRREQELNAHRLTEFSEGNPD
jgi:hypothetical protein